MNSTSSPHTAHALAEALQAAAAVVADVLQGHSLTDSLSRRAQVEAWTPPLRAQAQHLAYAAIRGRSQLEMLLGVLTHKPVTDAWVQAYLLVSLQALREGGRAPHTVVHQAVEGVVQAGQGQIKGLVNAILRQYQRQQDELERHWIDDLVWQYQHPEWWIRRLQQAYPEHWTAILQANQGHPPMTLRVNVRQSTGAAYLQKQEAAGLSAPLLAAQTLRLHQPVPVSSLPDFASGVVSVQDWGAQMAALWLDVRPGQRVLDACAAPGGKTAHILELAEVELWALDKEAARLQRVHENLRRLQLQAKVLAADAGRPSLWWDGRGFDRVLADVPCSASGVVRRHPDMKWLRRPADLKALVQTQAALLKALWPTLKVGGRMLYTTCSVFPEENQQQIASFLQQTPGAVLHPLQHDGMVNGQLLPTENYDGFYFALLEKTR